jgi:hypothetical protein
MSTKTFVSILVLIVLACAAASAQESRGTITGRVVDSSGSVVVGAEVRAVGKETGAVLNARTNDAGSYTLPYLLPGVYDLTAEFTGFKKTGRSGVDVRVNDVLNIEFRLEVGNATESVEVSGGAPLVEASNVTLGQVVEERQIKDLPLQAGNANELVLLTPAWSIPPTSASERAASTALRHSSPPTVTRFTRTNTQSMACRIRSSMEARIR